MNTYVLLLLAIEASIKVRYTRHTEKYTQRITTINLRILTLGLICFLTLRAE
jgi:hypothetical protein